MNAPGIRIAALQPSHIDALWQVFDTVAREKHYLASQRAADPAQMRTYLQAYLDQGHPYFVALADGVVVGWCGIQPVHGHARAHIGMLGMGLLADWRGQGIGKPLMQAALDAAQAYGFTRVELSVRADNARAIALYRRLGFVQEGLQRAAFLVDGRYFDLCVMALVWQPSAVVPANSAKPQARVRQLSAADTTAQLPALGDLLLDCVRGGASLGFMWPMADESALQFWRGIASAVQAGERALLVAEDDAGHLLGAVQLVLTQPANQAHRGDVAKLLVHHQARRLGVGRALMAAAEQLAAAHGKTLLVLDTETGSVAEQLYQRSGWQPAGSIPGYAAKPQGGLAGTSLYYKQL